MNLSDSPSKQTSRNQRRKRRNIRSQKLAHMPRRPVPNAFVRMKPLILAMTNEDRAYLRVRLLRYVDEDGKLVAASG